MEFASPPRKLLFQENLSSKKRNHLWNLLLLQENFSSKKTSPPRKEIIYGICFSSKKTSLPRKLLLQEKKSLMELSF
jgi:hypothetical protein